MRTVVQSSVVPAPSTDVWERITSFDGINDELRPWMRMTMPRGARDLSPESVALNEPLGRSWIFFLRVLPIDYDAIVIAELEPGRRFREDSTMLSMTRWQHERTLEPEGGGTRVTDRLTFLARRPIRWIPGNARLSTAIVGALFRHRHRRLARHFGSRTGGQVMEPPS